MTTTKMTTTPAATASVNRRQKIYGTSRTPVIRQWHKIDNVLCDCAIDDDSDRGMRRISYLKATAGNPVDGTASTAAESSEQPAPAATPIINEHTAKG